MVVPQRTCIGCRRVRARADLIRIVRSPVDGVVAVDPRGRAKGRGAYVCPNMDCINGGMQPQKLNRAFNIGFNSADCVTLETSDKLRQDLLELMKVQHH